MIYPSNPIRLYLNDFLVKPQFNAEFYKHTKNLGLKNEDLWSFVNLMVSLT